MFEEQRPKEGDGGGKKRGGVTVCGEETIGG